MWLALYLKHSHCFMKRASGILVSNHNAATWPRYFFNVVIYSDIKPDNLLIDYSSNEDICFNRVALGDSIDVYRFNPNLGPLAGCHVIGTPIFRTWGTIESQMGTAGEHMGSWGNST